MSTTYKLALGASVGVTTLIGLFSVMPSSLAATSSSSKNAVVTVGASCSMNSTVSTAHTATIAQGNYNKEIGLTEVTTTCNDAGGYAIYAVGYGDDTLGNNVLHSATVGSTYDIATGNDFANATSSYTSNTSQWAMRVETVPGQTDSPTITNNYDSLSLVPTTYTKVAQYNANTSTPSTSSITTEYGAYIAIGQPAGTYTGKVKYTLVHPSAAPTPVDPPSPPTSCNTPVPGNYTYLQDINSSNKASVLASLTEGNAYFLRDSRDEEPYCVSKLKDGNLWMLDNLRLDLTQESIRNLLSSANTNIDSATEAATLKSLKEGNRTAGNQYASVGFAIWNSSNPGDVYNQAKANADSKNTTVTSYGAGSGKVGVYYNYCAASAGSYCYNESAGPADANATQDICPAGWRMSTSGSSGEYQALYDKYNTTQDATNKASLQYNLSTPLSGYFYDGSAYDQGNYGVFWSSTRYGGSSMYSLYVYSFGVLPSLSYGRGDGYSVRCLLR